MKINISKVYAQYIGQFCVLPPNYNFSGTKLDVDSKKVMLNGVRGDWVSFEGIGGFYPIKDFKLILTPLSQITNEHAKQVNDFEGWHLYDQSVLYNGTDPKEIVKFKIGRFDYNFITAQFLMSLGYDIPQYHLDNKTCKEAKLTQNDK